MQTKAEALTGAAAVAGGGGGGGAGAGGMGGLMGGFGGNPLGGMLGGVMNVVRMPMQAMTGVVGQLGVGSLMTNLLGG